MNSVGIVTLPGKYNYGNRLQNYATSEIYQSLGFNAVTISIPERAGYVRCFKNAVKTVLGRKPMLPEDLMSDERLSAFNRFDSYINTVKFSSMRDIPVDEFDIFSTGSDQVWNPKYIGRNSSFYFLSFADNNQKIALSPSIGLDYLSRYQFHQLSEGVKGFSRLSVRERRGAELIELASGKKAACICDPTLVLSRDDWSKVADDRLLPETPYIFTYLLGGESEESKTVLDQLGAGRKIGLVSLGYEDIRVKKGLPAGPAEFISLIKNASHVVTDSFHAAVFSSIFEIPLTIVRRSGGSSMFGRLETLSQMLGIEEKVYDSATFDFSKARDYEGVPEAIDHERNKFMNYLGGCLDEQLPGWREEARD